MPRYHETGTCAQRIISAANRAGGWRQLADSAGPGKGLAGAQCTPGPAQPPSRFVVEHGAQPALRLCQVHLLARRIVGHLRGWPPPAGPHSARRTAHPASKAVSLGRTSSETRRNAGSRACRWPAQPTGFGGGSARAPFHLLTHHVRPTHHPTTARPPTPHTWSCVILPTAKYWAAGEAK